MQNICPPQFLWASCATGWKLQANISQPEPIWPILPNWVPVETELTFEAFHTFWENKPPLKREVNNESFFTLQRLDYSIYYYGLYYMQYT